MSDLADFVLGFCNAHGGIVEPPAYGVYDVLLPAEVAKQLGTSAFQRLAFDSDAPEAALHLGYGHPLVERMVESACATPACARFYVEDVRLDKRGLAALAAKSLSFSNARLQALPGSVETRALYHFLGVNFKAALITDEKREQLVTVWMDVQAGTAVQDPKLTNLSTEGAGWLHQLPVAPLAWLPGHEPTSREALGGLLDRAAAAAAPPLAEPVARLRARSARYLELDRDRLEQYFDDIEADVVKRLKNVADTDRRTALETKLAAVRADRAAKLADVAAKYRLRLELEPINAALVAQPKVQLMLEIGNRHATVRRTVVWDPLQHALQPLLCDACHRPTTTLALCAGGHLVCTEPACRARQCVDCARFYCRLCAEALVACVVCDRPICAQSQILCPDCGRGTCRAHVRLCHAAAGEPQRTAGTGPTEALPRTAAPAPAVPAPVPAPDDSPRRSRPASPPAKKVPPARKPAKKTKGARTAPAYSKLRLDVLIELRQPVVMAVVFKPRGRSDVAQRTWELADDGIVVLCRCEKGPDCTADHMVHLPAHAVAIEDQMALEILRLCSEYAISPRNITYSMVVGQGGVRRVPRLTLGGVWKDEAALGAARSLFDARYGRRTRR